MKHTVYGDIIHGKLHVGASWRAALQEALLVWRDGPVTLTVEQETATRSAQANAYYWGVVVKALSEYTGYTPDETHDTMKIKFLSKEVAYARGNGEVVAEFVIGGSTRRLNTVEFYEYVEAVRQWAFEALDVAIPPPDPAWRDHVEQERGQHDRRGETGQQSSLPSRDADVPRVEARRGGGGASRFGNGRVVPALGRSQGGADAHRAVDGIDTDGSDAA